MTLLYLYRKKLPTLKGKNPNKSGVAPEFRKDLMVRKNTVKITEGKPQSKKAWLLSHRMFP